MTSSYREFDNFATMQNSGGDGGFRGTSSSLQNISNDIQLFNKNVSTLERRINLLDTPQDSTSLRREIIEMVNDTVQLAKLARTSIDRTKDKSRSFSPPEKVQFNRLVSTFQNSLSKFQQIQQSTSVLEQELLKKARSASTTRYSPDSLPESERESSSYEVADENFRVQRQAQLETDSTALLQREREMHQLEHDILDVNDIFRDLGVMVHEQGDVIDNIESNVDNTAVRVVAGNDQLEKAIRHKKCSRKLTMIIVCIVVGVLVAIIIAAIILICTVGDFCVKRN